MNEQELISTELTELCMTAHTLTEEGAYDRCRTLLAQAMSQHPDAPEPHNLLGLLLERSGKHADAMKHFRAALALEPGYTPAAKNLELYGNFPAHGQPHWQAADCHAAQNAEEVYKEWSLGRFFRKLWCA